jgi:hypothetical protein
MVMFMENEKKITWLFIDDNFDFYQPKILAFTSEEKAMKYLRNFVTEDLNQKFDEEDEDNMSHDYGNGVAYVTSVEVED